MVTGLDCTWSWCTGSGGGGNCSVILSLTQRVLFCFPLWGKAFNSINKTDLYLFWPYHLHLQKGFFFSSTPAKHFCLSFLLVHLKKINIRFRAKAAELNRTHCCIFLHFILIYAVNVVYIWSWLFLLAGDHTLKKKINTVLSCLGLSLLGSQSVHVVTICKTWDAFMHIMFVHMVFIPYRCICKICLFMP